MAKARIITVSIEPTEAGLLRATSNEVPGLHVVSNELEELKPLVKSMLADLYEAQGQSVSIYEAEQNEGSIPAPWVVVPRSAEHLPH